MCSGHHPLVQLALYKQSYNGMGSYYTLLYFFFIHSFFQCDFAENMPVAIAPSNPLSSDDISVNGTVLEGLRTILGITVDNVDLIYVGFTTKNTYYLGKVIFI